MSILFAEHLRLAMEPDSPVQAPERLYQQHRLMAILAATLPMVALLLVVDIPGLSHVIACAVTGL